MFDSYVIRREPNYPQIVHEHRAPTDESVRLLKEFEEKADKKIVESIRLTNNRFEAQVHRHDDFASAKTYYKIIYQLNGYPRHVTCFVDDFGQEIEKSLEVIWKAIANDLASFLMEVVYKTVRGR